MLIIPVTHAVNTPLGHHVIQVPVAHADHAPLAHALHPPLVHHVVHAAPLVHATPAHYASGAKVAAATKSQPNLMRFPFTFTYAIAATAQVILPMIMRHLIVLVLWLNYTLILLLLS